MVYVRTPEEALLFWARTAAREYEQHGRGMLHVMFDRGYSRYATVDDLEEAEVCDSILHAVRGYDPARQAVVGTSDGDSVSCAVLDITSGEEIRDLASISVSGRRDENK